MPDPLVTLGARYDAGATTFRVWAPERSSVDVTIDDRPRPLARAECGYWVGTFDDVRSGTRYRYRLDGRDDQRFPDPASRVQPEGVHGPSQVIDPLAFRWTDGGWLAPPLERLVFYELHVGTYTPAGTFRGAGDFTGSTADLAVTIRQGWFFTGQHSTHPGRSRGTLPEARSLEPFVICIQNHDQIGNRADGARLNHDVGAATFRALTALLLLAPETPLLFMGQEWAASSPFLYFTDHHGDLGRQIAEGRREEFRAFAAFADPARRAAIPDPQADETFARSRLLWQEVERQPHAGMRRLCQRLLQLRTRRGRADVHALDEHTLQLGRGDLTAIIRLSGAGTTPLADGGLARDVVLTTEDADVTTDRAPIRIDEATPDIVHFTRPGAVVLRIPFG